METQVLISFLYIEEKLIFRNTGKFHDLFEKEKPKVTNQ